MELLKDLELVQVVYENSDKKAVLTFLDRERGEIREVTFNKQSYKDGKFVDDPEKEAKVEQWCKDMFNLSFDKLFKAVGVKKDVYAYDKFNSLFEIEQVSKFTANDVGQIIQTKIKDILVDNLFIRVQYEYNGSTYESKQSFGNWIDSMGQYMVNPQKKAKELEKFKDKYGVSIDEKDSLIGHDLIVEVKSAFGKHYYGDIKKFPKK